VGTDFNDPISGGKVALGQLRQAVGEGGRDRVVGIHTTESGGRGLNSPVKPAFPKIDPPILPIFAPHGTGSRHIYQGDHSDPVVHRLARGVSCGRPALKHHDCHGFIAPNAVCPELTI
jgi:hypothetical protein